MTTLANPEKRLPQTPRPKARLGFNTRVSFSEHTGGPARGLRDGVELFKAADLTGIPQRWLRDLTWDYIAGLLRSPGCPRTASPVDGYRRAATELGAFLELEAPGGGHDPAVLRREHMAASSSTSGTASARPCPPWRSGGLAEARAPSPPPPGLRCSTPPASCCGTPLSAVPPSAWGWTRVHHRDPGGRRHHRQDRTAALPGRGRARWPMKPAAIIPSQVYLAVS
jgi:hypothetical protein